MNRTSQDDMLNDGTTAIAAPEARVASGRRGAMRSLGAAALALVAGHGLVSSTSAKKAKAEKKGKRGKPGPAGPQGAAGATGPSGFSAITLVEDNQMVGSGAWNEGFAQCPTGQRVVAGGGYLDNDLCVLTGTQKAVVLPETWFAGGRCPAGQTSNIRVTAMCISS